MLKYFGSYSVHDLPKACLQGGMNPFVLSIGSSWITYFSKCELHLIWHFSFLGLCWDTIDMSVSLPYDRQLEIQQLAHSLLQR